MPEPPTKLIPVLLESLQGLFNYLQDPTISLLMDFQKVYQIIDKYYSVFHHDFYPERRCLISVIHYDAPTLLIVEQHIRNQHWRRYRFFYLGICSVCQTVIYRKVKPKGIIFCRKCIRKRNNTQKLKYYRKHKDVFYLTSRMRSKAFYAKHFPHILTKDIFTQGWYARMQVLEAEHSVSSIYAHVYDEIRRWLARKGWYPRECIHIRFTGGTEKTS